MEESVMKRLEETIKKNFLSLALFFPLSLELPEFLELPEIHVRSL